MTGCESPAHLQLKKLALVWAQRKGYTACAMEVRLPNSGHRADVVGYKPSPEKGVGSTAIFECKQVRADFLRDSHSAEPTLHRLKQLDARRVNLERLLKVHHPSLRNGDSLFQEFESYDLSRVDHHGYQKLIREIGILKNRLYDKTKFEKLVRYQCANLFYLVVEDGLMAEHESPLGWGMLVHRDGELHPARKPIWHDCPEPNRLTLLQRIAVTATRRLNREQGIVFEENRASNRIGE